MGLIVTDLAGELPLVRRVWSASCDSTTGFVSAAKASSMIVVTQGDRGVTVHLRGPETAGTPLRRLPRPTRPRGTAGPRSPVDEIRHGDRPRGMSERVAQARFRRGVGISHRKLVSIEQAQHAARLLTAGTPIAEVVTAAGYYDQPQRARAMRWATGHTPGELRSGIPFLAL